MSDFGDEIIIRDSSGKFKILRGGKFYDLEEEAAKPKTAALTSKLAEEVLKKSGIILAENLKERFADIVEAYRRDVRDKFETKATLTRRIGEGGMEISSEQADLVIKLIKEKAAPGTGGAETKKSLPQTGMVPKMEPEAARPKLKTPELAPGVREFVFSRADEEEIGEAREKLPKISAGTKPAEINKIIQEIIAESGAQLSSEARGKLEGILLTHFKDIRDGFETREMLGTAAGPAGVPLAPEAMEKILSLAREKFGRLGEKSKETELQKIKLAEDEEKTKLGEAKEKTFSEIKNKMDARWQEITRRTAPSPMDVPAEFFAPPVGLQVASGGKFARPLPSRAPQVAPPVPQAPATEKKEVSTPLKESAKLLLDLPEEEKPKPLQILKPISPQQVRRPIPPRDNRPRLDDVKYVPKLVGPVEELREMTLVDFRRLGANPAGAAEKIKEKIALLEREAFSKKIAGTKAWQESEVNKIYLEIGRESLQKGLSADKTIAERTAAGQRTLTVEEYRAVMELNRALRY